MEMKNNLTFPVIILLSCILFPVTGFTDQDSFDPETLRIDINLLQPERELETPLYKIHEDVINRGFINYYSIESPFGAFEAEGDDALEKRLDEIRAIDTLQKMSKSEVFTKTVGDTVSD